MIHLKTILANIVALLFQWYIYIAMTDMTEVAYRLHLFQVAPHYITIVIKSHQQLTGDRSTTETWLRWEYLFKLTPRFRSLFIIIFKWLIINYCWTVLTLHACTTSLNNDNNVLLEVYIVNKYNSATKVDVTQCRVSWYHPSRLPLWTSSKSSCTRTYWILKSRLYENHRKTQ